MSAPRQSASIGVDRIRELVPHAGRMCLLERVVEWDAASIRCETRSHLDPENPLRRNGHLSSVCGIEYAAQAMALHGALRARAAPRPANISQAAAVAVATPRHGYLASVRDTHCVARHLDEYDTALTIAAELVFEESSRVIYSFSVKADETILVSGRAAVVLG